MPARSFQSGTLTPEARKHLLLVACTVDRIDMAATLRRSPTPARLLAHLTDLPWFDLAASVVTRIVPRKARFLVSLWRMFKRAR